ncbi:MAG: hypothetical protein LBH51_09170 [Treponema sp.]|jgi:hypothetical protein|nr:hypothetical protein [Treponema sp.]
MNKPSGLKNDVEPAFPLPGLNEAPGSEGNPKDSDPLLLGLLNKAALLAFLFCFLAVVLYFAGLKQGFTGPNLLAIIQAAVYGGIALAIFSLYRFAAGCWFGLRRRRPLYWIPALGFLVLGVLGALVAAAGTFIAALAGGNA